MTDRAILELIRDLSDPEKFDTIDVLERQVIAAALKEWQNDRRDLDAISAMVAEDPNLDLVARVKAHIEARSGVVMTLEEWPEKVVMISPYIPPIEGCEVKVGIWECPTCASIAAIPEIAEVACTRPDLDLFGRIGIVLAEADGLRDRCADLAVQLRGANRLAALGMGETHGPNFPDLDPNDLRRAHSRLFGTLRDIPPGEHVTSRGEWFTVPPVTGQDWNRDPAIDGPATIIGTSDYDRLGITDASTGKQVVAALLADKGGDDE